MFAQRRYLYYFAPLLLFVGFVFTSAGCSDAGSPAVQASPEGYLFCWWNVENFFDDKLDGRNGPDESYDKWFANNPAVLKKKLDHLSEALIKLNGGVGPDIIALAEVETERAAELLRKALNDRLPDEKLHYSEPVMKEVASGRHIATVIITRLPTVRTRTQLQGRGLRILRAHLTVNNHDLIIMATHWTSRLTDKTGQQRGKYGDQVYGTFRGMYKSNPNVDFLVCGDFNDPPEAESVTNHLHAVSDRDRVVRSIETPLLFNLFANKDAAGGFGTHYDSGRWIVFDQVAVSPGLLDDEGWTCDPASAQTINTLTKPGDRHHQPWRFGSQKKFDGGYSDHFPVTVRLKVN